MRGRSCATGASPGGGCRSEASIEQWGSSHCWGGQGGPRERSCLCPATAPQQQQLWQHIFAHPHPHAHTHTCTCAPANARAYVHKDMDVHMRRRVLMPTPSGPVVQGCLVQADICFLGGAWHAWAQGLQREVPAHGAKSTHSRGCTARACCWADGTAEQARGCAGGAPAQACTCAYVLCACFVCGLAWVNAVLQLCVCLCQGGGVKAWASSVR